jgi:phosphoribosylpyrophosphate synthetase
MAYRLRRVLETFWGEATAPEREAITEIEKELDIVELDFEEEDYSNEAEKLNIINTIINEKINALQRIRKEINDKVEF